MTPPGPAVDPQASIQDQLTALRSAYPGPEALLGSMSQELGAFEGVMRAAVPHWNTRLPGRGWTPAQEADHTILVNEAGGKIVRLLLSDKPLREVVRQPGQTQGLGRIAPPFLEPGPDQPLEALLERHAATRILLEVHAEPDATRTFYHPFMDDIDALDWLRMAAYQTRHHRLSMQAGLDRLNAGQK